MYYIRRCFIWQIKIEDEFDLKVGQKALAEYEQDPVTYSVAEMRAKYGL